jgi:hypothetical protein
VHYHFSEPPAILIHGPERKHASVWLHGVVTHVQTMESVVQWCTPRERTGFHRTQPLHLWDHRSKSRPDVRDIVDRLEQISQPVTRSPRLLNMLQRYRLGSIQDPMLVDGFRGGISCNRLGLQPADYEEDRIAIPLILEVITEDQ